VVTCIDAECINKSRLECSSAHIVSFDSMPDALTHLCPIVLISIVKLEPDEANRIQLDGAAPELGTHVCICFKAPALPFTMHCNDGRMVYHLRHDKT